MDLLLARIAAPYYGIDTFDELPTPFRCVAVDLRTARTRRPRHAARWRSAHARDDVAAGGVSAGGRSTTGLLVDGGAMNNIPADVVRAMGADG